VRLVREMTDDIRWIRSYVVQEEHGSLGTVCCRPTVVDAVLVRADPA
jgi:hypothetical protein